eukprot:TRINITY_DN6155_c0_g1_i1.p1 TRINITY_DN6155_c0_g1~~TRINITY_DN6155_c0_g1_i1.p1  ORF type:complete len:215 (+),score=55.35 TRINITY_DN6155_c0_g1_i1:54-647(+)
MTTKHWADVTEEVVVTEEMIKRRLGEIADEMVVDYGKIMKQGEKLLIICILKGSYVLTADLIRELTKRGIPCMVDFMCVSSYGSSTESSGEVRVLLDLRQPMKNKHVLIVEDICESARTLDFLQHTFRSRSPASIKTITLLDKPYKRSATNVVLDYVGFTIPDKFVVGYGLDYDEKFRGLCDIISLKEEVYKKGAKL